MTGVIDSDINPAGVTATPTEPLISATVAFIVVCPGDTPVADPFASEVKTVVVEELQVAVFVRLSVLPSE